MTTAIAIASGKGGVGKTTISVNLSLSLALNKKNTILLDADLGMANTNLVLGINPSETLEDVVEERKKLQDYEGTRISTTGLIPLALDYTIQNDNTILETYSENISNTRSNPKVKIEDKFDSNNWYAKLLFANDLN